jgi:hypothetical protein
LPENLWAIHIYIFLFVTEKKGDFYRRQFISWKKKYWMVYNGGKSVSDGNEYRRKPEIHYPVILCKLYTLTSYAAISASCGIIIVTNIHT